MVDLSKMDKHSIGKCFDYSVLPKDTQEEAIRKGCREAIAYNCAAFYCSTPYYLPVVVEELEGSDVLPACGVSFPFGATTGLVKAFEAEQAYKLGARAIDTTMNIGALKDKKYDVVKQELDDFKKAAGDALTKCILDVCFLTDEEIQTGCKLITEAGIDYAKSSTGQFEGPTMEQVLIMREAVKGTNTRLKVAGVKFPRPQNAYVFLRAGVDLIGTRAAVQIIDAFDQMREIGVIPPFEG
ncbi:MAG: deoxyribose-phosphate aldolase [Eubacterium sp.]|nr:deoxyribose-phosphate aldolase [Eubacterium sp.]